jgi:hypothetical protein
VHVGPPRFGSVSQPRPHPYHLQPQVIRVAAYGWLCSAMVWLRAPKGRASHRHQRLNCMLAAMQHAKTNYMCPTADGWHLRLIRTQRVQPGPSRNHPVGAAAACAGAGGQAGRGAGQAW